MEMVLIDSTGLVYRNPSKDRKTFDESYESELGEKLKIVAVPLNQLELVIDVYREDSLKARCR